MASGKATAGVAWRSNLNGIRSRPVETWHGISFEEAVSIFADQRALTIFDAEHSSQEDRFQTIGISEQLRILLVVHAERGERIRLISARKATAREKKLYETQDRK